MFFLLHWNGVWLAHTEAGVRTSLDAFIQFSSLLVFLTLIEVFVTSLAARKIIELARRSNRCSRWIFPLAFIPVTALIFLRSTAH